MKYFSGITSESQYHQLPYGLLIWYLISSQDELTLSCTSTSFHLNPNIIYRPDKMGDENAQMKFSRL